MNIAGEAAVASIISSTGNKNVVFMQLDLLDLKSVRKFADDVTKKEKKVDILINNAAMAKQAKVSLSFTDMLCTIEENASCDSHHNYELFRAAQPCLVTS